jgi:hypothetical protein
MTTKEKLLLAKLEKENLYLREQLDKAMQASRIWLYEVVELKSKLKTLEEFLEGDMK